jgi:hypothetical protein
MLVFLMWDDLIIKKSVTTEYHYWFDIFTATIDHQLQKLNNKFYEQATKLLMLSANLNPKNAYLKIVLSWRFF